jgi:hypothetical protein
MSVKFSACVECSSYSTRNINNFFPFRFYNEVSVKVTHLVGTAPSPCYSTSQLQYHHTYWSKWQTNHIFSPALLQSISHINISRPFLRPDLSLYRFFSRLFTTVAFVYPPIYLICSHLSFLACLPVVAHGVECVGRVDYKLGATGRGQARKEESQLFEQPPKGNFKYQGTGHARILSIHPSASSC